MPDTDRNRRWILAVLTAVAFPALAFHSTCVAVMGPGTWGSGMEEVSPDFQQPTPRALEYAREFETDNLAGSKGGREGETASPEAVRGRVAWVHRLGGVSVYLAGDTPSGSRRQRLYVQRPGGIEELHPPSDHVVVRPHWLGDRIVYERWNPWALPAAGKLRRYFASWADPSLRPEAALYLSDTSLGDWRYRMPGHSLAVAPDGRHLALLRSGALLAGYYSVHVWRLDRDEVAAILSLREHSAMGTRSFSIRWSRDSQVLWIGGKTGGFERRGSQKRAREEGIPVNLLYLVSERSLYDLDLGD